MNPYLRDDFLNQSGAFRKQLVNLKQTSTPKTNRFSLYISAGINFDSNNLLGMPSSPDSLVKVALAGFELEVRIQDIRNPKVKLALTELGLLQEAVTALSIQYSEDYLLDIIKVEKALQTVYGENNKTLIHQLIRPLFRSNQLDVVRDVYKQYTVKFGRKVLEKDFIAIAEWFNAGQLEFPKLTTRA